MPTTHRDESAVPQQPQFEQALGRARQLVRNFESGRDNFLSQGYIELQARVDFIDKFWIALGWDVNHEHQLNPYEQQVKVERDPGGAARGRRADYAFLAPNFRDVRFFVEAKRPGANVDNADDYFQLIRYSWSSHVPVSVLMNFEQFRVIDCRFKPDIDTALQRRIPELSFHYSQFADADSFARVYYLFSRESVGSGSLERYAESLPKPSARTVQRGLFPSGRLQPMDESFLETLDSFRAELARSFKHRNAELGSEDLTEITQRTLDRLVFMRFLEDKLIESEPIVEALGDSGTAWQDFVSASRRLDGTYNGIIFKRHSILDSPSFRVDENVFEDVREHLAHTNSPYAFNYIPIHILGSIYERFLEKTIVTTDHRAEVKKKPEVRREGGVYYTPEYVVRYIVQQTVGKLIADKAPPDIRELRFADIACGSGSFLLAIYDSLLRRHAAYYNARGNKKKARNAGCIEAADGTFHLSLRQKREILVNNVFGVDIDPQAVEVAQLSLYLKLLEEETTASRRHYQLEFGEALLPNLSNNIRCGNSLVDWDFESDLFTGADEKHYRPFDFQAAFPEAFSRGGFDCIVGNPPYGMEADTSLKKYFDTKYDTVEGRYDRYEVFLERAYQLCREKGLVSYIIPSPFLTNVYTRQLRRYLLQNSDIEEIVNFSVPVFKDPTVHSCVVTLARRRSADHAIQIRKSVTSSAELSNDFDYSMPQNAALENPNSTIDIFVDAAATAILQKLERAGIALGTICYIRQCIKTGNDARYVQLAGRKPGREWKKSSRGRSIERYVTLESNLWVKYGSWLARNWANTSFYETPKIGVREAGNHIVATIDKENRYFLSSLYSVYPKAGIVLDLRLLLGILNSSVATYYIRKIAYELTQGAFTKIRTNQLARLPLPVDDSGRPRSDRLCRQVTMLVDRMLVAKNQLRIAESDRNRSLYEHKCAAIERRIDSAVAELYQLTHEERAVILRDVFGGQ